MKTGIDFLNNLLNALLPHRAAPVLARVMKSYEGPGKNKYSCDVKILKAGTLEETDQEIIEVPLNPIWATTKKRGVYAIPNEGQVVIVEFLEWNIAYPYISGIYSDEYEADKYHKDKFIITDGDGMMFIIDAVDKIITIDNGKNCFIKIETSKITVDNGKVKAVLNGDKCAVKNGSQSLFSILNTHIQNVHDLLIGLLPLGVPPTMCVSATDKVKLLKDKADLAELLED